MQPTYLPWYGYFGLIDYVDEFIFLNNVQFEKRSWQSRNLIKSNEKKLMLSIGVSSKGKFFMSAFKRLNSIVESSGEFNSIKESMFKEKDIVRHSLVRRLLKRYHDSFNIIDDVSAEDTISMWIHEQGLDTPTDGSIDDYHYKLKK